VHVNIHAGVSRPTIAVVEVSMRNVDENMESITILRRRTRGHMRNVVHRIQPTGETKLKRERTFGLCFTSKPDALAMYPSAVPSLGSLSRYTYCLFELLHPKNY
jgi:hypothetical protein